MKVLQQSEDWNCGIYSLYHSFNHLGIPFDPVLESAQFKRLIPKTLGLSPNDILKILLKKNVCFEEIICASDEKDSKWIKKVNSKLKKNFPLVLLTRDWGHWVTVVSLEESHYLIANSESFTGRLGRWNIKTLLAKGRNPGVGILQSGLSKYFGIDNLYAISIEG